MALSRSEFDAIDPSVAKKAVGLFTNSHMSYDLDRDAAKEPSLSEMSLKALKLLQKTRTAIS